jgi:hypothetical protein
MSLSSPEMGIWQALEETISSILPGEILTSLSFVTIMKFMD